jgi:hypothetical protein
MFEKIRAAFFKNALGKLLAEQKRQRKIHTLESARTIGVLFDAGTDAARKEVSEFVKKLEKDGKKVQLLGFFNVKQQPEGHPFDNFFLKETTWMGIPKSEKVTAFNQQKFDLLLSFNPENLAPMEWVAIASQAAMKIGLATDHRNDFDIQLETPEGKGMRYFTEQLSVYLDKIVLTKS